MEHAEVTFEDSRTTLYTHAIPRGVSCMLLDDDISVIYAHLYSNSKASIGIEPRSDLSLMIYAMIAAIALMEFPFKSECSTLIRLLQDTRTTRLMYAPTGTTIASVCQHIGHISKIISIPMRASTIRVWEEDHN
jgi:hypothetical protein